MQHGMDTEQSIVDNRVTSLFEKVEFPQQEPRVLGEQEVNTLTQAPECVLVY